MIHSLSQTPSTQLTKLHSLIRNHIKCWNICWLGAWGRVWAGRGYLHRHYASSYPPLPMTLPEPCSARPDTTLSSTWLFVSSLINLCLKEAHFSKYLWFPASDNQTSILSRTVQAAPLKSTAWLHCTTKTCAHINCQWGPALDKAGLSN